MIKEGQGLHPVAEPGTPEGAGTPPAGEEGARSRAGAFQPLRPLAGRRGRLTIFLGAAPGVGKTHAMLKSALDHARVLPHLLRRSLGDLGPVVEHRDPLGHAHHDAHVVLDQEDREAALVAQLLHEPG
jgi:hypothetical protein